MRTTNYHVIGVMSGTSLDGIDLAEINFSLLNNKTWNYEILNTETVSYPKYWKDSLQNAVIYSEAKVSILNIKYTQFLASIISRFIDKYEIKKINAVCSHGHTIWHQPKKGTTLQIGNLPELSHLLKQNVVCDFRLQDVKLGGNGAPLVPIGDRLLFNDYDYCLNLGGFANISYEEKKLRIAYDICPVNVVMNNIAEKLGKSYDKDGNIAAKGNLIMDLLSQLNKLSYYQKSAPKSLGLEWVHKNIQPLLEKNKETPRDILNTFVEHIAIQLSSQFKKNTTVLITGGGAYNKYLIKRLKFHSEIKIVIPSPKIIEFKEAIIFGFLGVLRLRGENNCLSSVTGAKKDHSSGTIFKIK